MPIISLEAEYLYGFERMVAPFRQLTVLVGRNNAGKSSLLRLLTVASLAVRYGGATAPYMILADHGVEQDTLHFSGRRSPPRLQAVISAGFGEEHPRFVCDITFDVEGAKLAAVNGKRDFRPPQLDALALSDARAAFTFEHFPSLSVPGVAEPVHSFDTTDGAVRKGRLDTVWRNWLKWCTEGEPPEKFQRVVDLIAEHFPGVGLASPSRSRSNSVIDVIFEEAGIRCDATMAGAGFRTLLTLAAILVYGDRRVVGLDEPDVHLHPELQRKAARLIAAAASSGPQVILSSHAPDFINEMPVEAIALIDRRQQELSYVGSVGRALVHLGAIRPADAVAIQSPLLLFVEGRDDCAVVRELLKGLDNQEIRQRVHVSRLANVGAAGDVVGFSRVSGHLDGRSRRIVVLRDPDQTFGDEPPPPTADETVLVAYLPCKELENLLLLQPSALHRAYKAEAERRAVYLRVEPSVPSEEDVAREIANATDDEADLGGIELERISRASQSRSLHKGDLEAIRRKLRERWADAAWRARWCSGKLALKRLRERMQDSYKLSITLETAFRHYDPQEELGGLLRAMEAHWASMPTDEDSSRPLAAPSPGSKRLAKAPAGT